MASRMPRLSMQGPGEVGLRPENAAWQAAGRLVTGRPAALMAPLERIQAPGRPGTMVAVRLPKFRSTDSIVAIVRSGGMRCGRTPIGMAIWAAMKIARVTAMAGPVRRQRAAAAVAQ